MVIPSIRSISSALLLLHLVQIFAGDWDKFSHRMYDFPAVCYLDLKFCLMSKAHHISFFFIVKNAREIVKLLRVGYLKKAETTLSRIPTLKKSAFCWGLSQPCLSWGRNRYEPAAPLQRRWWDLNPRAGCPTCRISSAVPSTSWVHLQSMLYSRSSGNRTSKLKF